MDIINDLSKWFVINVFLALLPLIIHLLLIAMSKENIRRNWKWTNLFRDGGLCFFSSTICATSISELVLGDAEIQPNILTFTLLPLMIILLISMVIFGCAAYVKFQEEFSAQGSSLLDDFRFSYGSIACAIASVMLGYVAFFISRG